MTALTALAFEELQCSAGKRAKMDDGMDSADKATYDQRRVLAAKADPANAPALSDRAEVKERLPMARAPNLSTPRDLEMLWSTDLPLSDNRCWSLSFPMTSP
jgi:hypothetical protein